MTESSTAYPADAVPAAVAASETAASVDQSVPATMGTVASAPASPAAYSAGGIVMTVEDLQAVVDRRQLVVDKAFTASNDAADKADAALAEYEKANDELESAVNALTRLKTSPPVAAQ